MKIAITGANGFVGNALCNHFLARGFAVKALVRKSATPHYIPSEAQVCVADYNNPTGLINLLEDCDCIIHNAGKTKALTHTEMLKANLGVTESILTAINTLTHPIRLIYISSQAVAGPVEGNNPLPESAEPNPVSSYGRSKLAAEQAIMQKCRQPWTIVRPCSVYGCGDKDFLSLFKMVKAGFAVQIGKQDKLLNMIHSSELASFLELCVLSPLAENQIFYATDGNTYTQSQVVLSIAKALNKKPLRIVIPLWLTKQAFYTGHLYGVVFRRSVLINREKMKEILAPGWLSSVDKATELLNWKPQANLDKHIKETAECYRKSGWL